MRICSAFFIYLTAILHLSSALQLEGRVQSTEAFQILGRFCFTGADNAAGIHGVLDYTFDFLDVSERQSLDSIGLLLFYQGVDDFAGVWSNRKSCTEKWLYAAGRHHESPTSVSNAFPLDWSKNIEYVYLNKTVSTASNKTARWQRTIPFKTQKQRFFYIAIANCNPDRCPDKRLCDGTLSAIDYKITMTNNGLQPEILKHFSWDENWNPITSYVLLALQFLLGLLCFRNTSALNYMKKFHHTVTMLNTAVFNQLMAMLFYTVAYSLFIHNSGKHIEVLTTNAIVGMLLGILITIVLTIISGVLFNLHPVAMAFNALSNWPWISCVLAFAFKSYSRYDLISSGDPISSKYTRILEFTARMYRFVADFVFLLLVMVLAYGWTIARRKLKRQARFKIVVIMTLYLCLLLGCLVWNEAEWDIATSFSIWESAPGYFILAARIGIYFWFVFATGKTLLRFNREKRGFYGFFFIVYSVWLVALPITCLVSAQLLPRVYINKTLFLVNNTVAFAAQTVLAVLYTSGVKCLEKVFPFHANVQDMHMGQSLIYVKKHKNQPGDNEGQKMISDVFKKGPKDGSKLVPVGKNHESISFAKRTRAKRIVSRVLTDNPTARIDYRLESVIHRLDRLFTTVFATSRIVQRLVSSSPVKKSNRNNAEEEKKAADEAANSPDASNRRPILSSNTAAAARWNNVRGIRRANSGVRAMKDIVDDNKTSGVIRQPRQRRQRRPRREAEPRAEEVGSEKVEEPKPEEPVSKQVEEPEPEEDELSNSRRARRPRRQRTTRTESMADGIGEEDEMDEEARRERRRRKKEKRRKKKERRERRARRKENRRRQDDEDED